MRSARIAWPSSLGCRPSGTKRSRTESTHGCRPLIAYRSHTGSDLLMCYGVNADEISRAFVEKHEYNMRREYKGVTHYEQKNDD